VLVSFGDSTSGSGRSTVLIGLEPMASGCGLGVTYDQPATDYGMCAVTTP
jgi:hypothetical protein